jgi:lipopolysaccharide transport system permease protein
MKENQEEWTEVISGKHHWLNLKLGEVWRYRDLIRLFVWRDFVAAYKQTLLGPLWHFINPLISTLLYTIVFGVIANIDMSGVPPFLFQLTSVTFWSYFARAFSVTQGTFAGNAGIFGKVYFPRLAVPIAGIISSWIQTAIMLALVVIVWIYDWATGVPLQINTIGLFCLPLFLLISTLLGMGTGAIVASLTTKYRDLSHFVGYGMSLLMYGSAVVYPFNAILAQYSKFKFILLLNPLTHVMEGFRYALFNVGFFDWQWVLYSLAVSVVFFLIGIIAFNITEKDFIDTV